MLIPNFRSTIWQSGLGFGEELGSGSGDDGFVLPCISP